MQMLVSRASAMGCTVALFGMLSMLADTDRPLTKQCPEISFPKESTRTHLFIILFVNLILFRHLHK